MKNFHALISFRTLCKTALLTIICVRVNTFGQFLHINAPNSFNMFVMLWFALSPGIILYKCPAKPGVLKAKEIEFCFSLFFFLENNFNKNIHSYICLLLDLSILPKEKKTSDHGPGHIEIIFTKKKEYFKCCLFCALYILMPSKVCDFLVDSLPQFSMETSALSIVHCLGSKWGPLF